MRFCQRWAAGLLAFLLAALPADAWGLHGHRVQARAAVRHLPPDVPPFLRRAEESLVLLSTEPDRWRTVEQPSLRETTGPNHIFSWELAPQPLPPHRHAFLITLAQSGALGRTRTVRDYGTAPYAIQEWAEMLTGAFRRWRAMPEKTRAERRERRHMEQSIIFIAGVLSHWVTDVSQPMHCSVHVLGWHPDFPNPRGYTGQGLHTRYENTYVERVIRQEDVDRRMTTAPRLLGPWLGEAATYIAACNGHVEPVYRWDQETAFGSGREPAAAQPFTADRLAEGARMLRDVWTTAWRRSGEPLPPQLPAATVVP